MGAAPATEKRRIRMDNYHITKKGNKWRFGKVGSQRSISNSDTKAEAIKKMRGHMENKTGSVKIHKENGQFQEERTYQRRDDPKKTPG